MAVIYIIINIATKQDPSAALPKLIAIIIVSYIAGLILKTYLKRTVFKEQDIDLTEDISLDEENTEEASDDDNYDDLL